MAIETVAVLGAGIMGAPMARNLAAAGLRVTVWNRTLAKAERLADVARVAASPAEAAAQADAIVAMLEHSSAVVEVLEGAGGAADAAKPGALVVDMSSIQPSVARDLAARAAARGLGFLDAPVSGGEAGAIAATLAIMAGGAAADFVRAAPIFAALGRATHVGVAGAGQVAKLANQAIVAVTIGAVAEALLLAQAGGCDPAAVRGALMGGFATSRILDLHGARMLARDFRPGGPVRNQLKDLDNTLEVARANGLTLPLTERAREMFATLARDLGQADADHAAYLLALEAMNAPSRLGGAATAE